MFRKDKEIEKANIYLTNRCNRPRNCAAKSYSLWLYWCNRIKIATFPSSTIKAAPSGHRIHFSPLPPSKGTGAAMVPLHSAQAILLRHTYWMRTVLGVSGWHGAQHLVLAPSHPDSFPAALSTCPGMPLHPIALTITQSSPVLWMLSGAKLRADWCSAGTTTDFSWDVGVPNRIFVTPTSWAEVF